MKLILTLTLTSVFVSFFSCTAPETNRSVEDQSFNDNWLFLKGEAAGAESIEFDDTEWRTLDLPHDWAIEGPFDISFNARTGGLPVHGTGWYRKHFSLPQTMDQKVISISFDGAMSNSKVWVNGQYVGERPYGYIGFEFDISEYVNFGGENILAVQLTPEDLAARWYTGAGIYRNVFLKINEPVHIPQWGTYITTPEISEQSATVNIESTIKNSSNEVAQVILETHILGEGNKLIASSSSELEIPPNSNLVDNSSLLVRQPKIWDIDDPNMYQVKTIIKSGDLVMDEFFTDFGIRTIEFTSNDGFKLNGRRIQLNGVCMHHDLGPLGAAVNYRATERQMEIMKSMGVNALRTSHNPPSREILDICDKMGIVVQVEAFDEWQIGKVENGYHKYFDEWHERDLRDMIKRDRNHPSVIMWSIGNEILEQGREDGWKVAKLLNDICHDEDPTRPTTAGFNYFPASFKNKLAYQIDVVGMNYKPLQYANIKRDNPDMIVYGSETSSQTSSRGVYHLPIRGEFYRETGHVSSYDVIYGPPWAYPPDAEFLVQEANTFSLGEFIWTGFDYLGEPTPYSGRDNFTNGYWNDDWPSRSSYFAPVDLSGFPKDRYYLYQSQWTKKPMVHVLPHWNWEGKEGEDIPVFAYSNAEEVELFVNGESMGRKIKGKDLTPIPAEYKDFGTGIIESPYRLSWMVPYAPGSLKVVAYTNNEAVAEKEVHTAEKPSSIKLVADRQHLNADGKDLSFITVRIEDNNGHLHPLADNKVTFTVNGEGELIAVGNGNQRSLESFQKPERLAFNGLCLLIVRTTDNSGEIMIKAESDGLKGDEIVLESLKK